MKKLVLVLIFLFAFSCYDPIQGQDKDKKETLPKFHLVSHYKNGIDIYVVEVESCHYVLVKDKSWSITHQGNCPNHKKVVETKPPPPPPPDIKKKADNEWGWQ